MKTNTMFHVKKRTLLAIAGVVWFIAGFNVSRMGIMAYAEVGRVTVLHLLLSLAVFGVFGMMFYKMSEKHLKRIRSYQEETKAFWHFFDVKSYLIMAFMMSGGIWLRSSGLVSQEAIAVFYTGLGLALALAGVSFWYKYFRFQK